MLQPSITFLGFTLHEPITVLTDLILCGSCFAFYFKLSKYHTRNWSLFFLFMSFATLFGALGHGLFTDKNNILQLISRMGAIVSVYFASVASIHFVENNRLNRFLYFFTIVQCLLALLLIISLNKFWIVKINATVGTGIIVAGIQIFLTKKKNKGSAFILTGLTINALTWFIHKFQISPDKWFNHNDLSHVVLLIGFYYIAQGAARLQNYAII